MDQKNATRKMTGKPLIESDRVEGTNVYDPAGNKIGDIKRLMIEKALSAENIGFEPSLLELEDRDTVRLRALEAPPVDNGSSGELALLGNEVPAR